MSILGLRADESYNVNRSADFMSTDRLLFIEEKCLDLRAALYYYNVAYA